MMQANFHVLREFQCEEELNYVYLYDYKCLFVVMVIVIIKTSEKCEKFNPQVSNALFLRPCPAVGQPVAPGF